jgi:glycosyltransferase involved in cell wall biosynthesis
VAEHSLSRSDEPVFISVIVPIFNFGQELLEPCLESLRSQTLRGHEFELILVDDASTNDATLGLLDAFVSDVPHARLVRHATNTGLNGARRSGRQAAQGTHIMYVDGDDILTRDAVETLRMHAHATGADIVTCEFHRWSPERRALADTFSRALPLDRIERIRRVLSLDSSFTMCGRLFRAEMLPDEVFDLPDLLHEDLVTFARVLLRAKSVHHIDRELYLYTDHARSRTRLFSARHVDDVFFAMHDWIHQVKRFDMSDAASSAIPEGVDRLTITLIGRCLSTDALTIDEKGVILARLYRRYRDFPLTGAPKRDPRLERFLTELGDPERAWSSTCEKLSDAFLSALPEGVSYHGPLDYPIRVGPTRLAGHLRDTVVFVCLVDYHLRAAASWASRLEESGWRCVILDNSRTADRGARQLSSAGDGFGACERIQIEQSTYDVDWLATAKLVLTFNDIDDSIRDALEFRHRLGLPSAAIVEGISDFLRVDFQPYRYLPYRRCSHVYLAGEADADFFADRRMALVGMPIVESLAQKEPAFPDPPLVAINVNFTYGCLEEARDLFVESAVRGCQLAGVSYSMTQHPADSGDLSQHPVTHGTQYELIDACSVFVSRFATGIIESLASGKPTIYFSPHGERVGKFTDPMGAFGIATTSEALASEIASVLADVDRGVDFRKRALPFLQRHAAFVPGQVSRDRFKDAVAATLAAEHKARQALEAKIAELSSVQEQTREALEAKVAELSSKRTFTVTT